MKYIYGPIKSRRLGLSLGLSLTPYKTCSFDCVYCQLGKTTLQVAQRKEYVKSAEILAELKDFLRKNKRRVKKLDYITLAGMGEPTLNKKIGELILKIKKIIPVKIAVITNSSFFTQPLVRKSLKDADLIVPSLDAVSSRIFQQIDRPHKNIKLSGIIRGLLLLRKEFKGKIWLEVMLVKGFNDSPGHIRQLKKVIEKINPDKIQLNSPVRSTTEAGILALDKAHLQKIKKILGNKAEII